MKKEKLNDEGLMPLSKRPFIVGWIVKMLLTLGVILFAISIVKPDLFNEIIQKTKGVFESVLPKDRQEGLELYCLNVGQGSGTMIVLDDEKTIMVDGGSGYPISPKTIGEGVIKKYLKQEKLSEIDNWVVSHSDYDHNSGLLWYLQNYEKVGCKINKITLPKYRLPDDFYDNTINYCNKYNIKIDEVSDKTYKLKGEKENLNISVFEPAALQNIQLQDHNEESLVVYVDYGDFETVLLGDLPKELKYPVVDKIYGEDVEILELSHHGSQTGTDAELLERIIPKLSIISVGDNEYGHPHKEVINLLTALNLKYETTKDSGTIKITTTNNSKVKIDTGL